MRKIEEKMINAIKNCRNWKLNNTEVKIKNNRFKVYLHRNLIFEECEKHFVFSLCGWNTPTTRSRLHEIFIYLYDTKQVKNQHWICQRQFEPYFDGKKINSSAKIKINKI